MSREIKVLLISPLPDLDPACGDVTYTQLLLDHPPDGVIYETYAQAIENGTLVEVGKLSSMFTPTKVQKSPNNLGLAISAAVVNRFRKLHLLFWEPYRFFEIVSDKYDLIHMHAFHGRFTNLKIPLVVSNAISHHYLYKDARNYAVGRLNVLETIERALSRSYGMNNCSYLLPQVSRVIAFTQFMKEWFVEQGIFPPSKIDVIPIYLPPPAALHESSGSPKRIGFVAKDFKAKGGLVLLKAFELLKSRRPDVELFIVGCSPEFGPAQLAEKNIVWQSYVPRDELLNHILPSFDVLAYPTNFDGLPLVVLEAMSMGIPIAASDYPPLVEVLESGAAGMLSPVGDADSLASNIEKLLSPDLNKYFANASKRRFENYYSADAVRPQLKHSYEEVLIADSTHQAYG